MDLEDFRRFPLMGILRGVSSERLEPLLETAAGSGLRTLEITLNTPGAEDLIRKASRISCGRLTLGAGTVLDLDGLKGALDAGATFIVTPVWIEEVWRFCAKKGICLFPGALTPSEIYHAAGRGAAMVKVFPARFFGPAYFKELKGPFEDLELLACSGVTPENLAEFFRSGASAVAFGASVFGRDLMADGAFDEIGRRIRAFVDAVKACRSGVPEAAD